MNPPLDASEVLEREFLQARCRILDLAATLDRIDRAPERPGHTPDRRLAQLRQAIEALLEPGPGRAETVQMLFSRDYDANWQAAFGHPRPRR